MSDSLQEVAEDGLSKSAPLTKNSVKQYTLKYKHFQKWKDENNEKSNSEATILNYFQHLAKSYKPLSLYHVYSCLKPSLLERDNVDIGGYQELKKLLKTRLKNYKPVPINTKLRIEEIDQFIKLAPDEKYLLYKAMVVLIMFAKCMSSNLYHLKTTDVIMRDNNAIIRVTNARNSTSRYIISDEYFKIFEKYMEKRRQIEDLSNLFLRYLSGKCLKQAAGITICRSVAKVIAKFLKLPNAEKYKRDSFHRMEPVKILDDQCVTGKHRQLNINVIDCNPKAIFCTQDGNILLKHVSKNGCNELECPIPNVRITNSTNISFNFS